MEIKIGMRGMKWEMKLGQEIEEKKRTWECCWKVKEGKGNPRIFVGMNEKKELK